MELRRSDFSVPAELNDKVYARDPNPTFKVATRVFRASIKYLNEGISRRVTDDEKLLLYGYYKQATLKEGEFFPPKPKSPISNEKSSKLEEGSREDAIALSKWNAWYKFKDLSKLEAMLGYVRVVDSIAGGAQVWREAVGCKDDLMCGYSSDDDGDGSTTEDGSVDDVQTLDELICSDTIVASRKSFDGTSLKGYLYKQSDVFRVWRKRYFVVENNILYYYKSISDHYPRGVLYLDGCEVSFNAPETDKESSKRLFYFAVNHQESDKIYKLAASSYTEAKTWVQQLKKLASKDQSTEISASTSDIPIKKSLSGISILDVQSGGDQINSADTKAHETSRRFKIDSLYYASLVNKSISKLLHLVSQSKTSWEFSHKKSDVEIFVNKDDEFPAAIGTTLIRAPSRAIWEQYWDLNKRQIADPLFQSGKFIEVNGPQTRVEHLTFKSVWPAGPRDFCSLSHWRLLEDGKTIIMASCGIEHPKCPEVEGVTRARMVVSGFVIEPCADNTGCNVAYLVQSNPGGNIPFVVTNKIQSSRPLILKRFKNILEPQYVGKLLQARSAKDFPKRQKHRRRTLPPGSNSNSQNATPQNDIAAFSSVLNLPSVETLKRDKFEIPFNLSNVLLLILVILFLVSPDLIIADYKKVVAFVILAYVAVHQFIKPMVLTRLDLPRTPIKEMAPREGGSFHMETNEQKELKALERLKALNKLRKSTEDRELQKKLDRQIQDVLGSLST